MRDEEKYNSMFEKEIFPEKEDDTPAEEENTNEVRLQEQETPEKVSVDTMGDFIDVLKMHILSSEDEEVRKVLYHHMVKLEGSLVAAGLRADDIYARKTPKGILGYYDPDGGSIAISLDLLKDFTADKKLYDTVLVHERTHKEGIMDEGLCQKFTAKKIGAVHGIYEAEQKEAMRTFDRVGIEKVFELYERDNPERLTEYYMEVEAEYLWNEKYSRAYKENIQRGMGSEEAMSFIWRDASDEMKKALENGAPRLLEKLDEGYLEKKLKKILEKSKKEE